MTYVILTADAEYGETHPTEGLALRTLNAWAYQVETDSQVQQRRGGQSIERRNPWIVRQIIRVPWHRGEARPTTVDGRFALARGAVLAGFRSAARQADLGRLPPGIMGPRRQIAVAFGHGVTTAYDATVDLAPVGLLRVHASMLASLERRRGPPDHMTTEDRLFDEIGRILRAGRIGRVDFYCCDIGHGPIGQALLDWIHFHWRIPVRGLRGNLRINQGESGGNMATFRVEPPSPIPGVSPPLMAEHERAAYSQRFETLITSPVLWARSHNRRPAPLPEDPLAPPHPSY